MEELKNETENLSELDELNELDSTLDEADALLDEWEAEKLEEEENGSNKKKILLLAGIALGLAVAATLVLIFTRKKND